MRYRRTQHVAPPCLFSPVLRSTRFDAMDNIWGELHLIFQAHTLSVSRSTSLPPATSNSLIVVHPTILKGCHA